MLRVNFFYKGIGCWILAITLHILAAHFLTRSTLSALPTRAVIHIDLIASSESLDVVGKTDPQKNLPAKAIVEKKVVQTDTSTIDFNVVGKDDTYVSQSELTELPDMLVEPIELIEFVFESEAHFIVLNLKISEVGNVDNVLVEKSTLSESDQNKIRDLFMLAKFIPGKIDGRPVKSELRIEMNHAIDGSQ